MLVALALAVLATSACALLAIPADASAAARKVRLDAKLERTPVIVRHDYRRLPPIGRRGAMGANLTTSGFSLASQQLGSYYVRAGLIRRSPRLIKRGFKAFNYAFRRQQPDGSFGPRQVEDYAFFVEAVSHSGLLVRSSRYGRRFAGRIRRYERDVRRATSYMIAPAPWAAFQGRNSSYTHTGYSVGSALALARKFTGRRELERFGRSAVRLSLSRQRRNGVNPELGGYDVRYQMAGIAYAERFAVYFPDGRLARRIERMTNRGLRWMSGRVAGNGYIRWQGSSRSCRERSSNGSAKTPGYAHAIRGFAYWAALEGRPRLMQDARRMHRYSTQVGGDSLCGPKKNVRRGGGNRGGGRGGGGGGFDDLLEEGLPGLPQLPPPLPPRLAQDLYE